jgi:hypothetical protein
MGRPENDDLPLLWAVAELVRDGADETNALSIVADRQPEWLRHTVRHRLARKWRPFGRRALEMSSRPWDQLSPQEQELLRPVLLEQIRAPLPRSPPIKFVIG